MYVQHTLTRARVGVKSFYTHNESAMRGYNWRMIRELERLVDSLPRWALWVLVAIVAAGVVKGCLAS
jgi:hypothetical protein